MGQTNYLKILWVVLYFLFAGISCWATAESLHLTWPSIPIAVCYGIAFGFYLVASVGATMVANAFNKNKFIERRGVLLASGIAILLFFWLITSLPTNTHTFLYRNKISQVLNDEHKVTGKYLKQIQTGQAIKERIHNDTTKLATSVKTRCTALEREIMNELNPGYGDSAKHIKREIANLLGIEKINDLSGNDRSEKGRRTLAAAYRSIIYSHLATAEKDVESRYWSQYKLKKFFVEQAKQCNKNLDVWIDSWQQGQVSAYNAEDISLDFNDQRLMPAYSLIKNCQELVTFTSDTEKQRFLAPDNSTQISQIISVYDLWYKYLKGEYSGNGMFMFFCIMISLLVDLAAFVFFYLTQK